MSKKPRFNFKLRLPEILLVFFILISGLSLGFKSGSFILNLKQIGFSIVSSVEKSVNYVFTSVSNTVNAVSELRQLKKDYNDLVLKLENYEEMQRNNAEIRKENERLKEQLDFSISLDEKNIPSRIISRDLDSSYSYLTIDKGSVNGIRKGMPVIAFQNGNNGLVGKVVQVGTFTAQIMPIYNIDNIVSARVQQTRDLGLVNGLGSLDQPLNLKYIRKSIASDLNYGDVIVTSGENDNYMKDIPIGTISKISILDYESSLAIELTPILDFSRLENVIVVNQKELNDRKDN
ncbi:MAG: rod shape-determining protein MreC [Treponema sp.]|nr:rod shape-determining protein MreC [Treponema sp.]